MKLFFIISSLLSVVVADPFLFCDFQHDGLKYGCQLEIFNPNNLNNFTEVIGSHLNGFTNNDVTAVYHRNRDSTIVPTIICDIFPNLSIFDFVNTRITEIDDTLFSGCSKLKELWLASNRISSIASNAFINLRNVTHIDLSNNLLTNLPKNVFANQQNLQYLGMHSNALTDIPIGLFRPLENLQTIELSRCNLNASINQLFATNTRLKRMSLDSNRFALSEDSFVGLEQLEYLDLGNNSINEIPVGTFASTPNLLIMLLRSNKLLELSANTFAGLERLNSLELGDNRIERIHDRALEGLENLEWLFIYSCNLSQLERSVFAPMPNLISIDLSSNRLKTLHRNNFGTLLNLEWLALSRNEVDAVDRAIIDDAPNLNELFLHSGNVCANESFVDFKINRPRYLRMLETCFLNFEQIADAVTTEGDANYQLFETSHSGMAVRVRADNEVHIALLLNNYIGIPMIEIFIGTANNTQSVIRLNQQIDFTVSTANIIARGQWNDFIITWTNENVLVSRDGDSAPFINFTMLGLFPLNFYGLRAVGTRALWNVQPFP